MTWLKRHERKLWWAFLIVCMVIGLARDPQPCVRQTPWWAWVVPFVVFGAFFYFQLWQIRKLREEKER